MAVNNLEVTNKLSQGYGTWNRLAKWSSRHPVASKAIKRTSICLPPAVTVLIDRIISEWSHSPATMLVGLVVLALSFISTWGVSNRIGRARSEVELGETMAELSGAKAEIGGLKAKLAENIDPDEHRALQKQNLTLQTKVTNYESLHRLYAGRTAELEVNIGQGKTAKQTYFIVGERGKGGMGTVLEVINLSYVSGAKRGRREILKMVNKGITDENIHARFIREARILMENPKLQVHRNIPKVFGYGRFDDGTPFYTMEYIEGSSLKYYLDISKKLSPEIAVEIMIKIADALTDVHKAGIIHRDLKPDNIMLSKRTKKIEAEGWIRDVEMVVLKIIDFGLAKGIVGSQDMTKLTQTGNIFGTPLYLSPEQFGGIHKVDELDVRADLYPLGVMFCQLLTGQPVYPMKPDESPQQFLFRVYDQIWRKGDNFHLPNLAKSVGMSELADRFSEIFRKLLHPNREKRYKNAGEFAIDLSHLREEMKELYEQTGVGLGSKIFASFDDD